MPSEQVVAVGLFDSVRVNPNLVDVFEGARLVLTLEACSWIGDDPEPL
jgi:hypothetical protein